MSWIKAIGGVFVLAGAGLVNAALGRFVRTRRFLANSTVTAGTVVAMSENREQEEISYFPRIRFRTGAGVDVTFESGMGSSSGRLKIGDSVTVRYRTDDPRSAEIDALLPLWGAAILLGGLGVLFLLLGSAILTGVLPVGEGTA